VAAKNKTAHALGIHSEQVTLPAETSEAELLAIVGEYNANSAIHGILVQLPLPRHIDEAKVLFAIAPQKDVDGFHPVNVGKMMLGQQCYLPCTPHGILELLQRSGVETSGAEVVVVGRSNIVGKPIANLMLQKRAGGNATVTVCHTRTKDMDFHTRRADILIVAAGVPKMIKGNQVKPGAVVIDVGVNRIGQAENGKAVLAGDVDFQDVVDKVSAITPVPGGVGPMTITMLMKNTVQAARQAAGMI
jgi:methylenetetrahydrofolate dehydrogenase (NADP+)/methenyltetrahydrofolate cyclohydrolase